MRHHSERNVMGTPGRTAVGYIRVSTDMQAADGLSLSAQRAAIKSYCESVGLRLLHALPTRLPFHLREHEENAHQRPPKCRVETDRLANRNQLLRPVGKVRFIQITEVLDRTTQAIKLEHHHHIRPRRKRASQTFPIRSPSRFHIFMNLKEPESDRLTIRLDRRPLRIERQPIRRLHVGTDANVPYSRPRPCNLSARDIIPIMMIPHIPDPFRMRQGAPL